MIIKGVQPTIGGLLSIQSITSFASLIRVGACVESSLRSGNFPKLVVIDGQINNFNSNRRDGTCNRDSAPDYSEQHAAVYVESPEEPAYAVSQPDPFSLVHAPNYAPTAHTATVEPVHHVAPAC